MAQFDGIIPELARAGYFNKINGIEAGIEDVYAQIGSPNGIAPLGENGLIEPQYLPSYVDDVLEYPDYDSLPVVGEQGKIYITVDETKVWRWSGTVYIEIVASPSSTDSVPEGLNNLYYTAERAQSDVVNITGNADTANRLSTARLVQLSGGVTGSGLFNGSSNLTIAATVVDDSHNHSTSTITGLSDVATSGDYSDLLNTPTLGSVASKDVPTTGNATPNQVVLGNDSRLSDARIASDVESWAKAPNKPTYTATEVGAQVQSDDLDSISGLTGTSGVLRKIGENQYELAQDVVVDNDLIPLINAIDGKVESSLLGVVNGVATLDGNGDIPLTQLPTHSHTIAGVTNLQTALDGKLGVSATAVAATTLTGLTSTITELNYVDGVTSNVQTQLNSKVNSSQLGVSNGVATLDANGDIPLSQLPTHSHAISDISNLQTSLDGKLGISATAVAATTLTGLTSTITELNYVDGVTSNVQTQLNGKQPLSAELTGIAGISATSGLIKKTGAGTYSLDSTVYTSVGSVTPLVDSGSTGVVGVSTTAARSDHVHPVATSVLSNSASTTSVSVGISTNGVAGTSTSISAATTSQAGVMSNSQVVSLNTAISDISTLQTTVAGKEPSFSVLPVNKGGTGVSSISGVLKGNGTSQLSAATSNDIVALVPDATTSQAGKMTTAQVTSLNELGGLVSMGSGVVKKTLSTTGLDTYATAVIADLVTSTNVVTNLNADMLDGLHVNNAGITASAHIPSIGADGVIELGKFIDFHTTPGQDFDVRLEAAKPADTANKANLYISGGGTVREKLWHAGNHGANSGLDADMLDGLHVNHAGATASAHIPFVGSNSVMEIGKCIDFHTVLGNDFELRLEAIAVTDSQSADLRVTGGRTASARVWHSDNHGANSGLDADTLDGNHASAFSLSGHGHSIATTLTDGFMSSAQVASLNELSGLVSLGSGVVKKTLSTSGVATYSTAAISDLATSGTGISIGSNQISLATLADSGTGSLLKMTRDAYGRVSGTSTVTASDIPLDATLAALANVTVAADKLIYATAPDTFSTTGFTAFARTLMDDTTDLEARSTLGIGSYGKYAKLITDWNVANENGVFMGNTSCLNSPEAGYWSMGHVENHGAAGWCTQIVHCFANDASTNTRTYRRDLNNGVWASNWTRVLLTEEEQKLIFLPLTGGTLTGSLTLAGDPSADLHPATKRWVESLSGKNSVRVATADVLGGAAYATQTITALTTLAATGTTTSGSASISAVSNAIYDIKVGATISGAGIPAGATVTAVASSTITISAAATTTGTGVALTITNPLSALVVDGVTLAVGNRVLVKNEYAPKNGLYTLTTLGTASVPWVLTRTTDGDTWADLVGAQVAVEEGTTNAETSWLCTANSGGTLGSTSLPWQLVSNSKLASLGNTTLAVGDTIYASGTTSLTKLAGNTTTTRKFMRQTGTGSASAAPAWDTLTLADLPSWAVGATAIASFTVSGFEVNDSAQGAANARVGTNFIGVSGNSGQSAAWIDMRGFTCNLSGTSGENLFMGSRQGWGDGFQAINGANVSVLNSTGLHFSNTVDNSASNTLSWYETGTFTPVLKGSTTAGTFTYSTQLGRYTRIGRMVYIDVNVTVTGAPTAPAGNLYITLPKTAISDTSRLSQAAAITSNLTVTGQVFVQTQSGSTNASVLVVNNGVSTAVSSSSDTTFTIQFSLAYVAA